MALNLSRSISVELSEAVSWFLSISSLFCLFRFGVGLSAELELDDRSERFDMNKQRATIVSITWLCRCYEKDISGYIWVNLKGLV